MLNFFRKKKLDSAHINNKRERIFLNYDNINSILIIFNINSWDNVQPLVDILQKEGKQIYLWTSRSKEQANVSVPNNIRVIDQTKDIKWTQSIVQPIIEEFEKINYDTFLDLTVESDKALDYLLAINTSKFCIGIRDNETRNNVYDFILHKKPEDSFITTLEHLKNYLSHIVMK